MEVHGKKISQTELAIMGMANMAYVRPVKKGGREGYAIHAADGTALAITDDMSVAIATIVEHDMQPVSVH